MSRIKLSKVLLQDERLINAVNVALDTHSSDIECVARSDGRSVEYERTKFYEKFIKKAAANIALRSIEKDITLECSVKKEIPLVQSMVADYFTMEKVSRKCRGYSDGSEIFELYDN